MKFRKCLSFLIGTLASTGMFALLVTGASAQDKIDFVKQIQPIFEQHCINCHGGEDYDEFQLDIRDEALNYIEEGSPDESALYEVLIADEDTIMPPADEEHPLTAEQIELVKTWIEQGASWPDDLVLVDRSSDLDTEGAAATSTEQNVDEVNGPDPQKNTAPIDNSNGTGTATDPKTADSDSGDTEEPAKAPMNPKTKQVLRSLGSLHPAAVHLPIGLLLAAGFFAFLGLRGNFVMSDCAYYCLWLGTFGAIAACGTGWYFSWMENQGAVDAFADLLDMEQPVFWHRTGGLVVTISAFLLALFAAGARNRDPDEGVLWKICAIVLAGGIGWVGHTGGELHYPPKHYRDLNNLYNSFFESGADAVNDGAAKGTENDSAPDDGSSAGSPDADNPEADDETEKIEIRDDET